MLSAAIVCLLAALLGALALPFIRQAGEDARLSDMKERGFLK